MPLQVKEIFKNNEIPIINENDINIKFFNDYAVVDLRELIKR